MRGVLTAGALSVGESGDDDVVEACVLVLLRALVELVVHGFEEELGVLGDVASEFHPGAGGDDVVRGDEVPDLDRDLADDVLREWRVAGWLADVGSADDGDRLAFLRWGWEDEHAVVDVELLWHADTGVLDAFFL